MGTHKFVCTNSMVFTALFVLTCLNFQILYSTMFSMVIGRSDTLIAEFYFIYFFFPLCIVIELYAIN